MVKRIFAALLAKAQKNGSYTSLDAMKLFAIINMTADHIGHYFYPDELWWRAIGRITFPVWFFLVGYSRTRRISTELMVYAALLVCNHFLVGRGLLPMNALMSIIICRLVLNLFQDRPFFLAHTPEVLAVLVILTFFTLPLFEYGSTAIIFALFGMMAREKMSIHFTAVTWTAYVTFVAWQLVSFSFSPLQSLYVVTGTAWVVWWLAHFSNTVIWPQWEQSGWKTAIVLLSRNTIIYYFIHRALFEIAANMTSSSPTWMHLKIF